VRAAGGRTLNTAVCRSGCRRRPLLTRWLLVGAWGALIYYLSGIPHLQTDLGIFDLILRKCAHLTEYGVLYLLWWRAYRATVSRTTRVSVALGIFICAGYAALDEFHQAFVPGRRGSAWDVLLFDVPGVLAMAYLLTREHPLVRRVLR